MLLEKLKQSSSQIEVSNDYEELSAKRDQLKYLDNEISTLNKKVNDYTNIKKLLITYIGNDEKIEFKEIKRANNNLCKIEGNIGNNELSNSGYIQDVKSIVEKYEEKLRDYWKEKYVLKVENTLSILQLLEKLYKSDDDMKILETKNKISRMKNSWGFEARDLDIMDEGIEEANNIIKELQVSRNIQLFLQKASIGEANILDLNEEIISWIKDHNFAEKVKLSFV